MISKLLVKLRATLLLQLTVRLEEIVEVSINLLVLNCGCSYIWSTSMFYNEMNEFHNAQWKELVKREELRGYYNGCPRCSEVDMENDWNSIFL